MKLPGNCGETEALTNRKKQYAERKAGSHQDLQDQFTKKALEPHTAWKPVQSRCTAASVLLSRMWGCLQAHDSSASSSWSTACFYGAEMTEAANTAPEKLQTLHRSLFTEGHRNTDTRCAQWNKGTVWFHIWIKWPYLNTFQLLQERAQCSSPRTPCSVGTL